VHRSTVAKVMVKSRKMPLLSFFNSQCTLFAYIGLPYITVWWKLCYEAQNTSAFGVIQNSCLNISQPLLIYY